MILELRVLVHNERGGGVSVRLTWALCCFWYLRDTVKNDRRVPIEAWG